MGKRYDKKRYEEINGDNIIYELRKKGKPFGFIAEYLYEKGVDISEATVAKICKKIFKARNEEMPILLNNAPDIPNDFVYELAMKHLKNAEIAIILQEYGIEVTEKQVAKKCGQIFKERGEERPIVKRGIIIDDEKYEDLRLKKRLFI